MARLRVNSEATVHLSKEDVAELHDVPEASVIDWGNGYAILNVTFIEEAPEAIEEAPEEAPKPKAKPKAKKKATEDE